MARSVSPGWTTYSQRLVVTLKHSAPPELTPDASPHAKHHSFTLPSSPGRAVTETSAVATQRSGLSREPAVQVTAAAEAAKPAVSRPISSGGWAPLKEALAMVMAGTPWKVMHCRLADQVCPTVRAWLLGRSTVSGLCHSETGPVTGKNMDTMLEKLGARHSAPAQHWDMATKCACRVWPCWPGIGVNCPVRKHEKPQAPAAPGSGERVILSGMPGSSMARIWTLKKSPPTSMSNHVLVPTFSGTHSWNEMLEPMIRPTFCCSIAEFRWNQPTLHCPVKALTALIKLLLEFKPADSASEISLGQSKVYG